MPVKSTRAPVLARLALVAFAVLAGPAGATPEDAAAPLAECAPIPVAEFAARRDALARAWGEQIRGGTRAAGCLLLAGAREAGNQPFRQSENVYYLTGVDEPDAAALLLPADAAGRRFEVLFLPVVRPGTDVWVGERLAPGAGAANRTGFARVESLERLPDVLHELCPDPDAVFVAEEPELESGFVAARTDALLKRAPTFAGRKRESISDLIHDQRRIKSDREIACLRAAVAASAAGIATALAGMQPGTNERRLQGLLEGGFLQAGADGVAFASIVGAGTHGCVLHYTANRGPLADGDLVVLDVGARVRGYCADVTRTVPVGGAFSARQRAVYEVVLRAQRAGFDAARPGATLGAIHAAAAREIQRGLIDLGLAEGDAAALFRAGDYRRYFPHFTRHWLGLAVHDVGTGPLRPGVAFTIEPGIYLPDEGFGIRIEDDYFMTGSGTVEKLSASIPSGADEVEAWIRDLRDAESR